MAQQCKILEEAYRKVRHNMGCKQDCPKELQLVYDHRRHGGTFQNGDLVMLYSSAVPQGRCKKLYCSWSGPYKVVYEEAV